MPGSEEDLSAYIAYHSSISNNLALISGFIFTSIVLLLTLLPDPTRPLVQLTLFLLSVVFNMVTLQLAGEEALLGYCVKYAPKIPKKYPVRTLNLFSPFVWLLLGVVVGLMYAVIGLLFLAVASIIISISWYLLAYFTAGKYLNRWQQWKRIDLYADTPETSVERDESA